MKRLILATALLSAATTHAASPQAAKTSTALDRAESIYTVFSETVDGDEVLALLLTRTPSKTPHSTGYCGAGFEDHAVLVSNKNGQSNVLDRFLLQSCLTSLTLQTDFPDDLQKSVKFEGAGHGISFTWLNGPDDKRHLLSVSNRHLLLQKLPEAGEKPSACAATGKSALRAQLSKSPSASEAWSLTELLLCGAKTPANSAYLRNRMPDKITVSNSDTGSEDQKASVKVDAQLIDTLLGSGEANDAELRVEDNELVLQYWPNEACVNGRTLRYAKGRWRLVAISDACD